MEWRRWIDALPARLRAIVRSRQVDDDLHDELAFHADMQTQANLQRGMSETDAGRRARGGMAQAKEQCRDTHPMRWAHDLARDLRYAQRSLRRAPGFTAVAIVTLALGIGANTAMFSVLNTYLFRPLPYPQSDQLVRIFRTSVHSQSWPHSAANFLDQREKNHVFQYMVAFMGVSQSLVEGGEPAEDLQGWAVTADFFPALGVRPALGRVFNATEDEPGANRVVVLSDPFWRRRFGADPTVVGHTLQLDGEDVRIIGVMPPGFDHPLAWGPVDIWRPMAFTPAQRQNRGSNYLGAFARLKSGVSLAQAQEQMGTLVAKLSKDTSSNQDESVRLEPLQAVPSDDPQRQVMWFTWGLAGFVLLIACANLANLQLVRAAAHAREQTIRAALGAGRFRLFRQALTESLVIAVLGGALSLLLAKGTVDFISRRLFDELPGASVTLDMTAFAFAALCSLMTGVVFGTVPALLTSRTDVNQALKDRPRGSTSSHARLRNALVVGQVAFAVVLLTGAGLFLLGLQRFSHRDPGWRVDGLLTGHLALKGADYATPTQRVVFYAELEQRLRALPGVQDVALSLSQPVFNFNSSGGIVVDGQPEAKPGHTPEVIFEAVSLRYFQTFGVRLLAGRLFTAADTADRPPVVIINETMAHQFWPNDSALGKRIARLSNRSSWLEVIGVVNDLSFPAALAEPYTRLQAFRPLTQAPIAAANITLRTSTAPEALGDPLRRAVAELIRAQPVTHIRTVRQLVDQGMGGISLLGTLLGAFAALGVLLAAVGIYGVTSYSVVQRTSEFGIRLALGAQASDVLWLVLARGARVVMLGALLGLIGAFAVARVLMGAIPTLPTRDPMALIGITLALVIVALVACYVPAGRASRMDPLVALRHE